MQLDDRCSEVRNLREIISDQENQLLNLRNSLNDKSRKLKEIGITATRENHEREDMRDELKKKDEKIREKERTEEVMAMELNQVQVENTELQKELEKAKEHENNM